MNSAMGIQKEIKIPADRAFLSVVRNFVYEQAKSAGVDLDDINSLVQAVDEAASNVIIHGYHDGPGEIFIQVKLVDNAILVTIKDNAPSFDPTQAPEPDTDLPLEQRPVGGLGIHLIRKCVDELLYSIPEDGGNCLILKKNLRKPAIMQ